MTSSRPVPFDEPGAVQPASTRRFVSCGEALIDLIAAPRTTPDWFSTPWQATSAGGPMNTAIALRRLGEHSSFLGRLSTDALGQQLRHHLQDNGVDLDLAVTTEAATSLAVVSLDPDGRADYTFHFADTANFGWQAAELPTLAATDWLHTGTLAVVVEPGASVLLEWAGRQPCPLSLDLNVRPTLIEDPVDYWSRLRPWLELVGRRSHAGALGVVKASDDDLEFLMPAVGVSVSPEQLMRQWVDEFGIDLGLLTLGAEGAVAITRNERTGIAGHRVEVADTIAAGDTFMAGFLAGFRDSGDIAAGLGLAAAASAIVVSRVGAQPPSMAEVDEFLADVSADGLLG